MLRCLACSGGTPVGPWGIIPFTLADDRQGLWGQSSEDYSHNTIEVGQGGAGLCLWEILRGGSMWGRGDPREPKNVPPQSHLCHIHANVSEYIIHVIGRVQAPGDPVLTLLQGREGESFRWRGRDACRWFSTCSRSRMNWVYTVGCFYPVTTVFNVFESIGGTQLIPSTPRLTLLI